jgi:hypothetical protein
MVERMAFYMKKSRKALPNKDELETPCPTAVYLRSQRLKNIFDCNRLTAKLINACLMGKIEETRATRIVYMIGVLMKGLELGDLEKRVAELERNVEERENGLA